MYVCKSQSVQNSGPDTSDAEVVPGLLAVLDVEWAALAVALRGVAPEHLQNKPKKNAPPQPTPPCPAALPNALWTVETARPSPLTSLDGARPSAADHIEEAPM
jgi:hypothetical protein